MKDKRGFTLVEILAVIVILAIIVGISIPAVTAIQKRILRERANTFFKVVGEATDLYVEKYGQDFDKSISCFEIPYDNLILDNYLVETNITCLSEAYDENKGTILARRVNDGDTFTYEYNLTCYDKETNKKIYSPNVDTSDCLGVNGGYFINVTPFVIKDGNKTAYDGEWTKGKIEYDVSVYNPYFYNVKTIQYNKRNTYEWYDDKTTITDSSVNGKGKIVFETDTHYDTSIRIRSVDVNNNISGEKGYFSLKLDNTKPVVTILDSMNGNWRNINNNPDISFSTNTIPSGLKNYCIDLDNNNTCDVTIEPSNPIYHFNTSYNGTIKVRAESNTGIIGDWTTAIIKVDLIRPTCNVEKTKHHTTEGVSLTVKCNDAGGSGCSDKTDKEVKSYKEYTVIDGAGNESEKCSVSITPYYSKIEGEYKADSYYQLAAYRGEVTCRACNECTPPSVLDNSDGKCLCKIGAYSSPYYITQRYPVDDSVCKDACADKGYEFDKSDNDWENESYGCYCKRRYCPLGYSNMSEGYCYATAGGYETKQCTSAKAAAHCPLLRYVSGTCEFDHWYCNSPARHEGDYCNTYNACTYDSDCGKSGCVCTVSYY